MSGTLTTDVFARQSSTRRRSRMLLFVFVVALVAIGLIVHLATAAFGVVLGDSPNVFEPSAPALALIGIVWLTVLAGCFFRWLDVRAGGAQLAQRFGAVPATDTARHQDEAVLLNVVAEIAIAASTPSPAVFVMRQEASVNAFVLGAAVEQRALVVTQGALDAFDRDELQAVVAHEFGHVEQGDLVINMRLLIALGGLVAIDEIGRLLIGDAPLENVHPGILVGVPLRLLGSVGVLAASLLRASISREREYLADASAVRFTRAPYALASALTVVKEADDVVALHDLRAQEIAHLCFSGGRPRWYARLFAAHPPLQSRIDALDPHFAVKRRKQEKASRAASGAPRRPVGAPPAGSGTVTSAADAYAQRLSLVGDSCAAREFTARRNDAGRAGADGRVSGALRLDDSWGPVSGAGSDRIQLLLSDEKSCLAGMFALFAGKDPIRRREYLDSLAFSFDPLFADATRELLVLMPDELGSDPLGVIEHATSLLRQGVQLENRRHVMRKLEAASRVNSGRSLAGYAMLALSRRKLDVEFPLVDCLVDDTAGRAIADGRRVRTFDAMAEEFGLLLSLVVESSEASAADLDADFARVLTCYTNQPLPRRRSHEPGVLDAVEPAFQILCVQPKPIRQAFVRHCAEIVLHDARVTRTESLVIELLAAALDCEALVLFPQASRAA